MRDEETSSRSDFTRCVQFHGHTCPGLAIGFKAAVTLMEQLGVKKASDEELVAIVETDACSADAIQVMTGCTFGKGNFIFKNYGKHAFSLVDRKRRKGIRACLRPHAFEAGPEYLSLSEKAQGNEPSPEESARFRKLQEERVEKILAANPESFLVIEEISPDIPAKARIMGSAICDFCREPTKMDLLRNINGKRVCITCAQEHGFGNGCEGNKCSVV